MQEVGGVGLEGYLTVAAILFVIGIFGIFVNRRNVIIILMSIELMLLTVAAAEAAIGLAILVCFFRNRGSISVEDVNMMKG